MDAFFKKTTCDRCGGDLKKGRIMSMFNDDCICMGCKDEETKDTRYKEARDAEARAVKKGDYNFEGIGR